MANDDPLGMGRVETIVMEVKGEGRLEWAWPAHMPMSGPGVGFFFPPEVGSNVTVWFCKGNIQAPLYSGGPWAGEGNTSEIPSAFQPTPGTSPTKRGIKTPRWEMLFDDSTPGEFRIRGTTAGDGQIIFKDDGTAVLDGTRIELGDGATDAIIGKIKLMAWGNTHVHPTGVGPSGVATPLLAASDFSTLVFTK